MKKFIKKILTFLIIVFSIGSIITLIANNFLKNSQFYKPSFLVNNFEIDKKFDFFIVGSSRGLTSINSIEIDNELGTDGVNISIDDTGLNTHFLMMKHFFFSGYRSDYCILVLDEDHFTKTAKKNGNNDYRFVPFGGEIYVNNYFKKLDKTSLGLLKNANKNPFFTYSYYNLELFYPSIISALKPNFKNKFDDKGNYSYPNLGKELEVKKSKIIKHTISNPLLKEIASFLNENGAKLIIYIAPYADRDFQIDTNYPLINHSNSIKDNTFFYDNIHVNKKGREKATVLFIDSFKIYLEENK